VIAENTQRGDTSCGAALRFAPFPDASAQA
jgi:hypothetical protein